MQTCVIWKKKHTSETDLQIDLGVKNLLTMFCGFLNTVYFQAVYSRVFTLVIQSQIMYSTPILFNFFLIWFAFFGCWQIIIITDKETEDIKQH